MRHSLRPFFTVSNPSRSVVVTTLAALLAVGAATACGGQTVGSSEKDAGPTVDGSPPSRVDAPIGTCNLVQIIPPVIAVRDSDTGTPICDVVLVGNDAGDEQLSPVSCPSGSGCSHTVCEYTVNAFGGTGETFSITVSAPDYNPAVVPGLMTNYCGCDPSQCPAAQVTTVSLVHMEGKDAGSPLPDASFPPAPDAGGGGGCPASEPVGTVACNDDGFECEYGTNPSPSCNDLYECIDSVWQNMTSDVACAPQSDCPATYEAASGSCTDVELTCQYAAGTCLCSNDPEGLPSGNGPGWACIPTTAGCPVDRPDLGTPCPNGSPGYCDYGNCIGGIGESCVDGYWTQADTLCPG